MSLQTRLTDLVTAVATDYKQIRVWLTGASSGTLASLNTTDKTSIISAINEVNGKAAPASSAASETTAGVAEIATQAETTAATDDARIVSPLKLQQKLSAWAQPLSSNLTALAGTASGVFGRAFLGSATVGDARTQLGLSAVAISGSATDITTGTFPSSVMPPLAINDTFVITSQSEMLALVAQRGDIAKRTDLNGKAFVLRTDSPTVLADWISLNTTSEVSSVAGRVGAVTLTKTDVGLDQVENTSDSAKPVSTAQQAALDLRMVKTANLSDLANLVAARGNLQVYSVAEMGNPETDLVAAYVVAKT